MHKKMQIVMLGVLGVGFLLIGIGAGVFGLEFSQLTYGGTRALEGELTQTVETFQMAAEDTPIWIQARLRGSNNKLDSMTEIKINEDLEPGMIQVAATYRRVPGMEMWMSGNRIENDTYITLSYYSASPMAMLLSCKDWVLQDLKNREWCEYVLVDMEALEITVNPADRDRIHLISSDINTMVYETGGSLDV